MILVEIAVAALSVLFFMVVGIVIHELGHLLCGLLTGYRFLSFRLLNFTWIREGTRIVLRRQKDMLVAGQCLMTPPRTEGHPVLLYNLGGGFANLLFAALCLAVLLAISDIETIWRLVLIIGFAINVFEALINLLTLKLGGIPNDGMNAWTATRSKEAANAMLTMLRVNSEMAGGKRYRDYDEGDFALSPSADRANYLIAWVVMAQAERLSELKRFDEGIAILKGLPLDRLPAYYRNMVLTELLYYCTVQRPDEARARALYDRKGMKRFLRMRLPGLTRVLAAYAFFIEGDRAEGWRLLEQAQVESAASLNKGEAAVESEWLDDLRQRFKKAELVPSTQHTSRAGAQTGCPPLRKELS
jgi:hypothetical protein